MSLVAASSLGKCPVLQHLAQLHMQTFNRIGGVDDFSHLRRITVKGNDCCQLRRQLSAIIGYFLPQGSASNSESRLAAASAVSAR